MNSRHYPFITILAATLLTVVPLCLVFLSTGGDSSAAVDTDAARAPVAGVIAEPESSFSEPYSPGAYPAASSPDSTAWNSPESRTPMVASATTTRMNDVARDYATHGSSSAASLAPPTTMLHSDSMSMEPKSDPVFDTPLDDDSSAEPAPPALMGKPIPVTPFENPARDESSYYDATRHLALADRSSGTDERSATKRDTKGATRIASADATAGESDRRSRGSSRRGHKEKTPAASEPVVVAEDETLEDVVLQTPLESRRVDRVENVVGVTRATGYPIALIRSDLPDDDWWVQQMVGYQGNTFAARVNFGNEDSLSGSAYRMVIVFLDSPDEVRRFRIAKRFKELPKGTRHSREFFYVRQ